MKYTPSKLIYVAGPLRAENNLEREQNIRRAEELALKVWQTRATAFCPHANTPRFFQGTEPDETWLNGDLEILKRCDGIIMTFDWSKSTGARMEHRYAKEWGIPIFYNLQELEAWLNGRKDVREDSCGCKKATRQDHKREGR